MSFGNTATPARIHAGISDGNNAPAFSLLIKLVGGHQNAFQILTGADAGDPNVILLCGASREKKSAKRCGYES